MRRVIVSAVALLACAVVALFAMRAVQPKLAARAQSNATSAEPHSSTAAGATAEPAVATGPSRVVTLEVGGMVCEACSLKVTNSLAAVPGMRKVDLDLKGNKVEVECDATVADTALTAAVRRAGPAYLGLIVPQR